MLVLQRVLIKLFYFKFGTIGFKVMIFNILLENFPTLDYHNNLGYSDKEQDNQNIKPLV